MMGIVILLLSLAVMTLTAFLVVKLSKIDSLKLELKQHQEVELTKLENAKLNYDKDVKNITDSYHTQVEFLEDTHERELKDLENLFKQKTEEYDKSCDEYEEFINTFQKYYLHLSNIIHISDQRIKQIDAKGLFKSDDEIGFFFENIKEIQDTLNEFDFTKPETRYKPKPIAAPSPIGPDGQALYEGGIYISPEKVQELINDQK